MTPTRIPGPSGMSWEEFTQRLGDALRDAHIRSSNEVLAFPSATGAFPDSLFLPPPPVVPDSNRLRDDIRYVCRKNQRTTLITAASEGLIRLFCAQHVVDEVFAHGGEWSVGTNVSRAEFLRRWTLGYLPVIRVVPTTGLSSLLSPDEAARLAKLEELDSDDVPSATLALALGAFYLSNDRRALQAVYGRDVNLTEHTNWLEVLRAGGDAGELGRMFNASVAMAFLVGSGLFAGARRLFSALGLWTLLPVGGAVLLARASSEGTRQRLKSAASSIGMAYLEMYAAYQQVLRRFERAAPMIPSWGALASTNSSQAVLSRACLYALARSPMSNRSAAELAMRLPVLTVAHSEARVRHILRTNDCFHEVVKGRWQAGEMAGVLATIFRS